MAQGLGFISGSGRLVRYEANSSSFGDPALSIETLVLRSETDGLQEPGRCWKEVGRAGVGPPDWRSLCVLKLLSTPEPWLSHP